MYEKEIMNEVHEYLTTHRTPLLLALFGAIIHLIFTKSTLREGLLKFACAFLGALVFAPAITEYFSLSIRMNNLIVLSISLGAYYVIKGLLFELEMFSKKPKTYFFDLVDRIKGIKKA